MLRDRSLAEQALVHPLALVVAERVSMVAR